MMKRKNIGFLMAVTILVASSAVQASEPSASKRTWLRFGVATGVALGSFMYQCWREKENERDDERVRYDGYRVVNGVSCSTQHKNGEQDSRMHYAGDQVNVDASQDFECTFRSCSDYERIPFDLFVPSLRKQCLDDRDWGVKLKPDHRFLSARSYKQVLSDALGNDARQNANDSEAKYDKHLMLCSGTQESAITKNLKAIAYAETRIAKREQDGRKRTMKALAKSLALGALVYNQRGL